MRALTFICIISALLSYGCSRLLPPAQHDKARSFEHRCNPPAIHRSVSLTALDKPVGESGEATAQLPIPEGFSPRALDAAYAIQALPLLKELSALEQQRRLGEPGSAIERKRIALLFGDGGVYELQDLRANTAMLKLLASTVEMMAPRPGGAHSTGADSRGTDGVAPLPWATYTVARKS